MFNSVQASRFVIVIGTLVLLVLSISGMEAGADEGRAISTVSTSNVASLQVARATPPVAQHDDGQTNLALSTLSVEWLQVARSPSSVTQNGQAGDVSGLSQDYLVSWQDGSQPTSRSFDLDTSLKRIGGHYQTVDGNERNSTRVARIAAVHAP